MRRAGCRGILVALAAWACSALAGATDLRVENAWAGATLPGQKVAGVFMTLTSAGGARLVGVDSPAARVSEIHEMRHENGVMKMRRREALELPAGEAVKLAPGGYHIMLKDIHRPLAAGQEVTLDLVVEAGGRRESVTVKAPVRALGSAGGHDSH